MVEMNGHRWGAEGPPPEAYSRVTNPERFAPLHVVAAEFLRRLELEFDATSSEGYGLDRELEEGCPPARPTVGIVPRDVGAAPVVVAFSAFPGLRVRFGHWYMTAFPSCGCDACDETVEGEAERLKCLIDNLTAGRYREAIRIRLDGVAWQESEFWSADGRYSQESPLDPARAVQLVARTDQSSHDWGPWRRRR